MKRHNSVKGCFIKGLNFAFARRRSYNRFEYFKIFAVCLIAVFAIAACKKGEPQQISPPTNVLAEKAVKKDVPIVVSAIGNIEASKSVSVYSLIGGQLIAVHFKEGQDVREGQPLFSIDPAPYREKLRQAEGKLAKDLAQLKYNQEEAKRYEFLFEKGAVAKSEADKYLTEAASYDAGVKISRAELEEARLNLAYCEIRAPFSGRTGAYGVNKGAIVKANETSLTTLNKIAPIYARFSIPEKYLSEVMRQWSKGSLQVKVGQSPDFKGEVKTGKLIFIDNSVDTATGMIQLKAEFPNADSFLWPGQFVNVAVQLDLQRDCVVVPLRAVQMSEKGNFVLVVKHDMTTEIRPVVVDRATGEEAVIAKGITAGETVVTDGHLKVRPGGRVEIKDSLPQAAATKKGDAPSVPEGGKKP